MAPPPMPSVQRRRLFEHSKPAAAAPPSQHLNAPPAAAAVPATASAAASSKTDEPDVVSCQQVKMEMLDRKAETAAPLPESFSDSERYESMHCAVANNAACRLGMRSLCHTSKSSPKQCRRIGNWACQGLHRHTLRCRSDVVYHAGISASPDKLYAFAASQMFVHHWPAQQGWCLLSGMVQCQSLSPVLLSAAHRSVRAGSACLPGCAVLKLLHSKTSSI